jgi:hypothetical protein
MVLEHIIRHLSPNERSTECESFSEIKLKTFQGHNGPLIF